MLQLTNHVIISSIDRSKTFFSFLPSELVNELDCYRGDVAKDYLIDEPSTIKGEYANELWVLRIYQEITTLAMTIKGRTYYKTDWDTIRLYIFLTKEEYPRYLELLDCALHRRRTSIRCIIHKGEKIDEFLEYQVDDDCFVFSNYGIDYKMSIPHELLVEMYKVTLP